MIAIFHKNLGLAMCICLCACIGAPQPGAQGTSTGGLAVNPNACGGMQQNDALTKLRAFIEATVRLDQAANKTHADLMSACKAMGREVGMDDVSGDLRAVCNAVNAELHNHLSSGIRADAKLTVDYEPAVCAVDAEVSARFEAECRASGSANVDAQCNATCQGACNGTCEGTMNGTTCEGVCRGTCEGTCHVDTSVDVDAACTANAETRASIEAQCTEPKLDASADASITVDEEKLQRATAAIRVGMLRILIAQARLRVLVRAAATTVATGQNLARSMGQLAKAAGNQVACVTGQVIGAAALAAQVVANIQIQVEVTVEVSATAGISTEG